MEGGQFRDRATYVRHEPPPGKAPVAASVAGKQLHLSVMEAVGTALN